MPEILAQLLKSICLNYPDCLRSSITPLINLASCGEAKSKEFNQIFRDDIVLEVQSNSNPKYFWWKTKNQRITNRATLWSRNNWLFIRCTKYFASEVHPVSIGTAFSLTFRSSISLSETSESKELDLFIYFITWQDTCTNKLIHLW